MYAMNCLHVEDCSANPSDEKLSNGNIYNNYCSDRSDPPAFGVALPYSHRRPTSRTRALKMQAAWTKLGGRVNLVRPTNIQTKRQSKS